MSRPQSSQSQSPAHLTSILHHHHAAYQTHPQSDQYTTTTITTSSPQQQQQTKHYPPITLRPTAKITFTLPLPSRIVTQGVLESLISQIGRRAQLAKWRLAYSLLSDGSDLSLLFKSIRYSPHTIFIIKTNHGDVIGGYSSTIWVPHNGYQGNHESFVFRIFQGANIPKDDDSGIQRIDARLLPPELRVAAEDINLAALEYTPIKVPPKPPTNNNNDIYTTGSSSSSMMNGLYNLYGNTSSSSSSYQASTGPKLTGTQRQYIEEVADLDPTTFNTGLPEVFPWRGPANYYTFTNKDAFGWGGGGGVSIFIDRNLGFGKSEHSDAYQNPRLSKERDFKIYELEVWAGE